MKFAAPTNNGIKGIEDAFSAAKQRGRAALIPYICGGYDQATKTVDILLAMQKGGADIIELGIPCLNPFADGDTIKESHKIAIDNGTTGMRDCLRILETARSKGLTVPIILMAYYSSLLEEYHFNVDKMCRDAAMSGANGFLMVGVEEGQQELDLNSSCYKYNLSSIQLVRPGSSDRRIAALADMASSFLYVVSSKGKTGARDALPKGLDDAVARVRAKTDLPLVVGFGISNPEMVKRVSNLSDGAVVGSFLTDCIGIKNEGKVPDEEVIYQKVMYLRRGTMQDVDARNQALKFSQVPMHVKEKFALFPNIKRLSLLRVGHRRSQILGRARAIVRRDNP
eukprot:scaffold703_cov133-Skeletonema_dohrnii-CCMP3373.AAC.4